MVCVVGGCDVVVVLEVRAVGRWVIWSLEAEPELGAKRSNTNRATAGDAGRTEQSGVDVPMEG